MTDRDVANGQPLDDDHIPAPLAHRPRVECHPINAGRRARVHEVAGSDEAWIETDALECLEAWV